MKFQHIRPLSLSVGLMALLALSPTNARALSDDQIQSQIERRLSQNDALLHVTVSVLNRTGFVGGLFP